MASAAETRQENGLSATSEVEAQNEPPSAPVAEGTSFPAKPACLADSAAPGQSYANSSANENLSGALDGAAEPCPSPSGAEVDSIPQWKRDLIHRRKTNIARTIGANQAAACPIKALDSPVASTSPVPPLTKSPASGGGSSASPKSSSQSQSPGAKTPASSSGGGSQLGPGSGHYTAQTQAPGGTNTSTEGHSGGGAGKTGATQSRGPSEEAPGKCASGSSSGTCLTTSPQPPQQVQPDSAAELQQPFQSHSRHDIEKSSSSCSFASGGSNSPSSPFLFAKNPSVGKSCKTLKYRANSSKSSAPDSPLSVGSSTKKKMVAAQDIGETSDIEFDFDPSEELQYGPGIVSKLRCRYLSLALRQSAGKQRPPLDSLRRATSLNNLLDDDEDSNSSSCVVDHGENQGQKSWNNAGANATADRNPEEFVATFQKNLKLSDRDKRSRQIKRGNDSLKRARSVEALLSCEKTWDNETAANLTSRPLYSRVILQKDCDSPTQSQSQDIIANAPNEVTIEDKISNARGRILLNNEKPPKRLTSIIDDTERPPPDLVKQTLKMFEATANRRGRGLSRNNFNGEVAAKVASYKCIISQEKPPIVFPKPPLSPKKHFRKPGGLDLVATKKNSSSTQNSKKTQPSSPVSNITKKFSVCDVNTSSESNVFQSPTLSQNSSPTASHRPEVALRNSLKNESPTPPARNSYGNNYPRTPDIIQRKHVETSSGVECSPIAQLTRKMERLAIESPEMNTSTPIQESISRRKNSESDESVDGNSDNLSKRVSKGALENISKAGATQHISFSKTSSKPPLGGSAVNGNSSTGTADQPGVTTKQVGVIRPLVSEPKLQTEKPKSSEIDLSLDEVSAKTRDNLVITNLSQSNTVSAKINVQPGEKPSLTSREIEKNLINEKKNEEAGLESATTKWQLGKKKSWNTQIAPSQNNCMVFNFKDRKEVPDYIENDGLIFKRRRELPKPNESGFVLLGDLSLETSTDPEDSWTMGPPSPCDVEFLNANIIIDGKSSMRYTARDISLRVQFDDTLTSTFEYPSETSFVDESVTPNENSFNKDIADHITVDEIIQIPSPMLLGNVSLGSAPLSSYTPVKAPLNTNFELGVTRSIKLAGEAPEIPSKNYNESECSRSNSSRVDGDSTQNGNIETDNLQYLKPATDDLTVAYSEGTEKADLLY